MPAAALDLALELPGAPPAVPREDPEVILLRLACIDERHCSVQRRPLDAINDRPGDAVLHLPGQGVEADDLLLGARRGDALHVSAVPQAKALSSAEALGKVVASGAGRGAIQDDPPSKRGLLAHEEDDDLVEVLLPEPKPVQPSAVSPGEGCGADEVF